MNRIVFLALLWIPIGLISQSDFPWPMAPRNEQHRISSTFDECREDRDHFHNGTDIPLAPGEDVLAIVGGTASGVLGTSIRVGSFAYVHVIPLSTIRNGDLINAGDVVGRTDSYAHVHLNYGYYPNYGNPLLPGGLTPFEDPYHPRSPIIEFVMDGSFTQFPTNSISGRVDIIAQAADTTDLLSSIDMNNGIYTIGWALHSGDTSEVLAGPYFNFEADEYYSSAYINNVYAPGSSTSIYKYIVTNRITTNSYLDCDQYEPGPYVVSVMSSDARDNWDTTYVRINISDIDLLPPPQPVITYLGAGSDGNFLIEWPPVEDADLVGYKLEFSTNGETWASNHGPDILTAEMTSFTIPGLSNNFQAQFRLRAVDDAPIPNLSEPSDTYGIKLDNDGAPILIVDGFDRTGGSWSANNHNFATYYSEALREYDVDHALYTVSNEWIIENSDLSEYKAVFWFVGDDSRTSETFSTSEQNIISTYLESGGAFFASGAEIGYDLSAGTQADLYFLNEILHVEYSGDNADDYNIIGHGSHFSGIGFTYGATPYVEDWPDHFAPSSGGEIVLKYGNDLNAGIAHRNENSASFVMGFAFETIATESDRAELLERVMQYFEGVASISETEAPTRFGVKNIYPNPFNAASTINFELDASGYTLLTIYDIQGREVMHRSLGHKSAGSHSYQWSGVDQSGNGLPSGPYFVRLTQDNRQSSTHKMLMLK